MDSKTLALDFSVKAANLCRHLKDEKKEDLISPRLFSESLELSKIGCSVKNPVLSKQDVSALRKNAALTADSISLCLETLYMSSYISAAQKDSMTKSLTALKKEINI